jgi:hypothetical protein
MIQRPYNFTISRDGNFTNSSTQQRLIIPIINLNGPPNPIIPNGFPGGLLYNSADSQIYYSDGKGWYLLSGSGGNSTNTDAFIFYDPTNLASGGGWGAAGPSSNLDINPSDPQITTPNAIWSTMYSSGNASIDGATGTITIIKSGLYKVNVSVAVIVTAPIGPTTITTLLYGGSVPPQTYFATQTLSSSIVGFNASGTLTSTTMRMWDAGFQLPLKFNWFTPSPANFVFSPYQISLERIGDYNPVPPYP